MKALLQRVNHASVRVDGAIVGKISRGLLILVGFGAEDSGRADLLPKLRDKILTLRLFPDDDGRFDRSVKDIEGGILLVSQFTLYGRCDKGRRPDFTTALEPVEARELFEKCVECFREIHSPVACGEFGADMKVSLENDGPVTISLEVT